MAQRGILVRISAPTSRRADQGGAVQGVGVVHQLLRLGFSVPPYLYISHNHTDHSGEARAMRCCALQPPGAVTAAGA